MYSELRQCIKRSRIDLTTKIIDAFKGTLPYQIHFYGRKDKKSDIVTVMDDEWNVYKNLLMAVIKWNELEIDPNEAIRSEMIQYILHKKVSRLRKKFSLTDYYVDFSGDFRELKN